MKKYKNFINEEQGQPDLRKMTGRVRCIKTYHTNVLNPELDVLVHKIFVEKGKTYNVGQMFGDPQRAIEEFGINDYMPIQCISKVEINGSSYKVSDDNFYAGRYLPRFFEYFELLDNLKKVTRPDIDPFGEEDWGWEETNESIADELRVGEQVECIKSVGEFFTKGKYYGINKIHDLPGGKLFDLRSNDNFNMTFNKVYILIHFKKADNLKKITRPDIDPFGEEDWGWEETNEGLFSKYTENQAIRIIKKNSKLLKDYEFTSHSDPDFYSVDNFSTGKSRKQLKIEWNVVWVGDNIFVYVSKAKDEELYTFYFSNRRKNIKHFISVFKEDVDTFGKVFDDCGDLVEFLKKCNIIDLPPEMRKNKMRKIRRIDIDPFDEEDWGYEDIN